MENSVDYASALFQRASNYVSHFGAAAALAGTSDPNYRDNGDSGLEAKNPRRPSNVTAHKVP
jgi:hypothetical protein